MRDGRRDHQRGSPAAIALGALAGGVAGGLLALVLAPDGRGRARGWLREFLGEARQRTLTAAEAAEDVRQRVEDFIDQGRALVKANMAAVSSAYEAGREAFHRERERLQAQGAQPDTATCAAPSTPESPVTVS